jgi:hypothetical protein
MPLIPRLPQRLDPRRCKVCTKEFHPATKNHICCSEPCKKKRQQQTNMEIIRKAKRRMGA